MAFTLFCREFGNVVNRALLVLVFWIKKLVGANFTRFCNYDQGETCQGNLPAVSVSDSMEPDIQYRATYCLTLEGTTFNLLY